MRWLTAAAVAVAGAAATWLLGGPIPATLPAALLGFVLVLAVSLKPVEAPVQPQEADERETAPPIASVLDAIDDPLLLVDAGRVAHANPAAERVLGGHIADEDVRVAIRHPAAAERILGRSDRTDAILLVGLGEGDRRWELTVHPLGPATRLVRLADRSNLHAAERARVDFVANASHELRTPLSTLLGFIETLEDANAAEDGPTRARFLKIMLGEARRMQRLVDDLMSLSRIEAEKHSPPQTQVDVGQLVEEVRRATLTGRGEDGGRIVVELADDAPAVTGDRIQLTQLLHNLIGNALKYGRAGSAVTVGVRGGGGMLRLTIADEGDGIPEEHIPRLTERFYRVDAGRSRALGGTGLGLAIVKHIVERHRGRLEIQSKQGQGTTVTVLLPATQA
ncbi:ATP-binding protein [Sphingomonas jatrophae]|uniref:histidine kinase n=1 Tax=Sphingomonas jatrophae TaxID=1166337 RepID=A0A1I6JKI0_9SPHN|nr:ATP-binding protein [Sphingomonas jatrophae]SFR79528.1 two-component system, OmpR family, phosphate regulon sensor histidine kinase PhoR [Sphingomonas jatrophae]